MTIFFNRSQALRCERGRGGERELPKREQVTGNRYPWKLQCRGHSPLALMKTRNAGNQSKPNGAMPNDATFRTSVRLAFVGTFGERTPAHASESRK